jgi:DNA-binding transcriptional MerR regulator
MTQWYVKDLSKLTHVSVQTLHHYDRIGLLRPSVRLTNGYRLYSEKDLLTLQQIIALKFFGFELALIKKLLAAEMDVIEHFSAQSLFLEKQANTMLEASSALKKIISDCHGQQSIHWETIIKLIEVYRMTNQLEKTWAGKIFDAQELKDYANFEKELQTRFTAQEKADGERAWQDIINDIEANLHIDPASETGIALGKRCMDWVNELYGSKYAKLRKTIWEKGFKQGHGVGENQLSAASVAWLDSAIKAYYYKRIYQIVNAIGDNPSSENITLWNTLMAEKYNDDHEGQRALITALLNNENISVAGKTWLKKIKD